MAEAKTYRKILRERAEDQYGYVTTGDAEDLGVPKEALRKFAYRGGVAHIAHGLYRFEDIPLTGKEQFMEAVLRVGANAYLVGDAVLALNDLGLVNPRRIRVAVNCQPHRQPRRQLPAFIEVVQEDTLDQNLTRYEGIPATTVAQALRDCQDLMMTDRFIDAVQDAARTGLIRRRDADSLLRDIDRGNE